MRSCRILLVIVASLLLLSVRAWAEAPRPIISIGIVTDGPWERRDEIRTRFETELRDLLDTQYDLRFPAFAQLDGGWSPQLISASLDSLLRTPEIDLVLALGILASQEAGTRAGVLPKPVIAPFVLDAAIQGLPQSGGASGVKNLSYLTWPNSILRDWQTFHEIVPFTHLAFLTSKTVADVIPNLAERCNTIGDSLGIRVTPIPVDTALSDALAAIPPDADAVSVAPLFRLPPGSTEALARELIARRLPSFSLVGRRDVQLGILAGLGLDTNFDRIARRTALHAGRILNGEDAGTLPVAMQRDERITINMATARAIGCSPPWSVITEAELIAEARTEPQRVITLESVIAAALAANPELAAAEHMVAAGAQEIASARSNLLPRIDLSAQATTIDEDRAAASLGSAAERQLTGSIEGRQLIFSDAAWANLSIERRLQDSRVAERDRLRLDITQEAASAFFQVLRARAFERIQKENLSLTRSHLDLARTRLAVGAAGPSDVYRWESEIASGRRAVIDASAARNLAEMDLNRLLNRPTEEPFLVADILDADSIAALGNPRMREVMNSPVTFRAFRDALSEAATSRVPELRQIDAQMAAQKRALTTARRAFFLPSAGLSAGATRLWDESGAGASFASPIPGLAPAADETDWFVGLEISFPLFEGGNKLAVARAARQNLSRLELERASLAAKVEQRTRSALHQFGASYAGIALARDAALAARNSLELVSDAYARGAVSIVNLLDAQSAALVAEQGQATSVYDCLLDWIEVERAAGGLQLLAPDGGVDWLSQLSERIRNNPSR
ncbi:MAG: TolC family protein [Candidatus Zixiibacteriota bacterium]